MDVPLAKNRGGAVEGITLADTAKINLHARGVRGDLVQLRIQMQPLHSGPFHRGSDFRFGPGRGGPATSITMRRRILLSATAWANP